MIMPMNSGRRWVSAIPAKRIVAGNLVGRQQGALSQVGLQVNRPQLTLKVRNRVDLRPQDGGIEAAGREREIEFLLGLDDLGTDRLSPVTHARVQRFGRRALRVGQSELVG